ncbi:MAG: AI-2E family transporter [Oligoflexia bacterium]|nr:AI-2E family transporter [Oligoflexia bacterium]
MQNMENQNTSYTPAHSSIIAGCLLVITTILVGIALSFTRNVMIPFVFALFLSYLLDAPIDYLKKKFTLPHWLAVSISFFGLLIFIFIVFLILRGSIANAISGFYIYEEKLKTLTEMASRFSAKYEIFFNQDNMLEKLRELPLFSFLQTAAGRAAAFIADFLLVIVFLLFLVSGAKQVKPKSKLSLEIDMKIRNYIVTKIVSNFFAGFLVWIVYVIFGLDLALMFALLTFLLCFIPTLGSIVSTLLPLPVALLQYDEMWKVWIVLAVPAFLQIIIGNVIEPKFLGKGLDLHPITILLSLMFWGLIWGVAGMFLAVPITAVLRIIFDQIPLTKGFSELLAGRSPI